MTSGSGIVRLIALATASAISLAACGGSGGDDAASPGESGQAGVVLETAPTVESAVVDSTTTSTIESLETTTLPEPATTVSAPDVTTVPSPDTTTTMPAPDTAPARTEPPESVSTGVPVGYRPIIDESGNLRANVPAAWIEINGAPDGALRQLAAAPDLPGFLGGYAQLGMVLITGEAATPDAWMDGLATTLGAAESDGCETSDTSDYDDGVYAGTEHLLSCGSTESVAHLIGGRNSDGGLFFLLALVRPTDDPDVRDQIVQSFFID